MSIFDSLVNQKKKSIAPTKTVGVTGAKVYSGYIDDKEKDARLRGSRRWITYSEMLSNTSIVAAATRYFLNLSANSTWKVVSANDSAKAKEIAEFVESAMHDMETTWTRVIRKSAMYRYYGFGVQEWTAKRLDNGMIGMRDVASRPQSTVERWGIDEVTGKVNGIVQRAPIDSREIYIPREKFIYIVDDTLNDSPEGLGLFRNVVSASERLRRFEELEAFGFEGNLRGIPVARIPYAELDAAVEAGKMSSSDRDKLIEGIEAFLRAHIKANPNTSLAMDSSVYKSETDTGENPSSTPLWDFSLLEGNTSGQVEVAAAIERINLEIARVLGVEQLLLGNGEGSQALSRDKSHNFAMIIDSTLTDISEAFNADYVRRLCLLNGFDKELWPKLSPEKMRWQDIQSVTGALRDMAQAGAIMSPDDPAINDVREMIGISEAPEYDKESALTGGMDDDDLDERID